MNRELETVFELPQGMQASVEKGTLTVKSSGKQVSKTFNSRELEVTVEGNGIKVRAKKQKKRVIPLINAFVSHMKNIVLGLSDGFEYRLEIVYSHFPMTVTQKEKIIEITNVGGSKKHRLARVVGDSVVQIKGKEITVTGLNKEHVGQTAANMEQVSKIKGKDKRVFQDGIYIVSKPKRE